MCGGENPVNHRRALARFFHLALAIALMVTLLPVTARRAHAQSATLVLSVPAMWEDTLTDLLAEFEAQNPGVTVALTLNETSFFGGGPMGGSTVEDTLDAAETLASSADVMYIDSSSLTPEATQAGYFLDLQPLVMNDPTLNSADFIPAAWQAYQWDSSMWALPLSTDVIVVTYDPAAFDAVGLAYPNERWTIDDFANAARLLTVYNADGSVLTPGFSTVSGGNNLALFLRAAAGVSLVDEAAQPDLPQLNSPQIEHVLQVWYELRSEGVVLASGGGLENAVPLRVEGINGYGERGFRPGQDNSGEETRYASLLPGATAGLSVQGFAVSAGTQYPDLAYALAKFLVGRSELASNPFSATPARYSLIAAVQANSGTTSAVPGQPGGMPGQPGGMGRMSQSIPEAIRPTIDQGLANGLGASALRYSSYLSAAITEMESNGGDALSALQAVEAQAISDARTAQALYGTVSLFITPPPTQAALAPGKIALNCAVNLGFGGGMGGGGGRLGNQEQWDALIASFTASDPVVGQVNLENVIGSDLAQLTQDYDCIILSSNAVPDADLSTLLNLDPLMDADPTFDRNDVIGNTLAQLQRDNKTWALPLTIEPQMLQYNPERFAWAGVPEPVNGWTADTFTDALKMLKPYDTDPTPFVPSDPSGSYLLMLIAAYGGLPLDYRTDPPTVNFTDPATVEAIRQVLDLASAGYISYAALTQGAMFGAADDAAITTNTFNRFRGGPGRPGEEEVDWVNTLYPQGTQYNALAYQIGTAYISVTAQNPEATYRFLSLVSRSPQLFDGMPARQSLVSDPAVVASQGEEVTSIYRQLDALLRSPNTIVFPTFTQGRGSITSQMASYWLLAAFDSYVVDGADLETALADAQMMTLAYQECVASIAVDTSDVPEAMMQLGEQIMGCATSVDPSFSMGF